MCKIQPRRRHTLFHRTAWNHKLNAGREEEGTELEILISCKWQRQWLNHVSGFFSLSGSPEIRSQGLTEHSEESFQWHPSEGDSSDKSAPFLPPPFSSPCSVITLLGWQPPDWPTLYPCLFLPSFHYPFNSKSNSFNTLKSFVFLL